MQELISRQAVIDMFQNLAYSDWNQGVSTTWANAFAECVNIIESLPSVQPEITRCRDCNFYDGRPCGIVDYYNTADDFCSRAERRENG